MPFTRADVRHLLQDALDEGALDVLCSDYFPTVYRDFTSGQSFGMRIQKLLDFVERTNQVEPLLVHVNEANPRRYAEWERPQREAELQAMVFHRTGALRITPFVGRANPIVGAAFSAHIPDDSGTFSDPDKPLSERDWRAEIARWENKMKASREMWARMDSTTASPDSKAAQSLVRQMRRETEAKYLGNLANGHAALGEISRALELYGDCLRLLRAESGSAVGAIEGHESSIAQWNMALAYARQWQWEHAIACAQAAAEFFRLNLLFTAPPALPARLAEWKRTLGQS